MELIPEVEAVLNGFESQVQGLIAVSYIDLDSGRVQSSEVTKPGFDLAEVGARTAKLVVRKLEALKALEGDVVLEDVLLSSGAEHHLIKILPTGRRFLFLAARKNDTNLALIRRSLKQAADRLA